MAPRGKATGHTGPKFSETEREEVKLKVAHYDRLGENQYDIQRRLAKQGVKVSQSMVGRYLWQIREDYRVQRSGEVGEMVAEATRKYQAIYEEAKAAWFSSQEDGRRVIQDEHLRSQKQDEEGQKGKKESKLKRAKRLEPKMLLVRLQTTTEGRLPATEYLRVMMGCLEAIRELHGLDKPKKVDAKVQQVPWDALALGVPEGEVVDMVEAEIQNVLDSASQASVLDISGQVKVEVPNVTKNGSH